ncbi:MAG: hypothetical protein FWC27_13400 [Firmicutes bacterium]|nr:hypothetical protein [Bacillota bacterium]
MSRRINKKGFPRRRPKPVRPMLLLIPTLVVSLLMAGGATLAWFISTSGEENKFESGIYKFNIELVDTFTQPPTIPMPGGSFSKTVSATNTGDIPGFVRLLVQVTAFADDPTQATPLPMKIGREVNLNIFTADWMLGEDGYYYYLGLLAPGETAPPLFTDVILGGPGVLDARYVNATMKIEVKVEGVDYYKWHYRDGWWVNPASPPSTGNLGTIEGTLSALAK